MVWRNRAHAAAGLPRNVLCSATAAAILGCASWRRMVRSQATSSRRSALTRRETSADRRITSMLRGCRPRPELLHQDDHAFAVLGCADADALDVHAHLPAPAVQGVDIRFDPVIAVSRQGGERLFQLLDRQADVESEEMLAV